MKHNVTAPSVGESITEVSVLKWAKQDGQAVKSGDLLLEIESDKATVEIVAENAGVLKILKQPGERVAIGTVIGEIDDAGTPSVAAATAPVAEKKATGATAAGPATMAPSTAQSPMAGTLSPAAQRVAADRGVDPGQIQGTGRGGRVTKGDAMQAPMHAPAPAATPTPSAPMSIPARKQTDGPGDRRVPMSLLRQKIAERLVHAQHTAAILTTFNEVDMSAVMQLRAQHKESFKAKHGVNLSFMSFFTRACVEALKAIPEVNATIDGKDIVYHDYCDVGIAVGTDRGLVVPILRGAQDFGFVDIERKIGEFAIKARDGKLSIADMSGGTFTISNGGTYGSLMSTPILNPPQSGILGMHKIMDRPMVVNGKVEVRPMMYIALSYDHRIIDGKGAVTFLVMVKDFIENPQKLGLNF